CHLLRRALRPGDGWTIGPDVAERDTMLLDPHARVRVTFSDRLIERFPVAQSDFGHRRFEKKIRLLAHDAPLCFRTNGAGAQPDGDDRRRAAHTLPEQPPERPFAVARVRYLQIDL